LYSPQCLARADSDPWSTDHRSDGASPSSRPLRPPNRNPLPSKKKKSLRAPAALSRLLPTSHRPAACGEATEREFKAKSVPIRQREHGRGSFPVRRRRLRRGTRAFLLMKFGQKGSPGRAGPGPERAATHFRSRVASPLISGRPSPVAATPHSPRNGPRTALHPGH